MYGAQSWRPSAPSRRPDARRVARPRGAARGWDERRDRRPPRAQPRHGQDTHLEHARQAGAARPPRARGVASRGASRPPARPVRHPNSPRGHREAPGVGGDRDGGRSGGDSDSGCGRRRRGGAPCGGAGRQGPLGGRSPAARRARGHLDAHTGFGGRAEADPDRHACANGDTHPDPDRDAHDNANTRVFHHALLRHLRHDRHGHDARQLRLPDHGRRRHDERRDHLRGPPRRHHHEPSHPHVRRLYSALGN